VVGDMGRYCVQIIKNKRSFAEKKSIAKFISKNKIKKIAVCVILVLSDVHQRYLPL
jgi:hypothetical protein